ncbi:hypothetical protein GCM10018952_03880 [Streptosporangium vulgare]
MALSFQLAVGLAAGLAIGFLLGRARASSGAADVTARLADAEARAKIAEEKVVYIEGQLSERFQALSSRALDVNNLRFLELAETRLAANRAEAAGELEQRKQAVEHLIEPLKDTLARVETQLRDTQTGQRAAHAELAKHIDVVRESNEQLRAQTNSLVRALQRPEARGRWGELQLRRVAEIAGMQRFCDFDEQVSVTTPDGVLRPDMIVRLAGGKNIVVDSKVSLSAYLEAAESADPDHQSIRLDAHARHVRDHVDRLASKPYWQAFSPAPEFMVLFIPGEAFLAPALERDPALLEYAMRRRVHIATPHHADHHAPHRAVRLAAGRARRERAGDLRGRQGAVRAAEQHGAQRRRPGTLAEPGRGVVQQDGRLAGDPGAGERPQAERSGAGRDRPGHPAGGRGPAARPDLAGTARARGAKLTSRVPRER